MEPFEEESSVANHQTELGKKLFGLAWSGTALILVLTYWQTPFFFNLFSSFRVQILVALSVLSLPCLFLFSGRTRFLFLALPSIVAMTFASYFLAPNAFEHKSKSTLRIAVANVYSGNSDLSRLKTWLEENPVDILGVLEMAPHHREQFESLELKHVLLEPREGNFGLAYLSREKPLNIQVLDRESPFPSILAEYESYEIVLTHPVPPLNREARAIGDAQIMRLAEKLKASKKPTVFMGDFNATGWDDRVYPLKEMGLRDSRKGYGLIPTWPVGNPIFQIPIDHIFLPQTWSVTKCSRGPDLGSDHYPLSIEIAKPE